MDKEPDLEELLSESSRKTPLTLTEELKYFAADGSSYACYYGLIMGATELLVGLDWEQLKTTRGAGFVTGFLFGRIVNLLRERGKDKQKTSSITFRKATVDTAIGIVTTMPGYAPILYLAAEKSEQGITLPLVIGSVVSGIAGLGYGLVSDWYRKRLGLQPVFYG